MGDGNGSVSVAPVEINAKSYVAPFVNDRSMLASPRAIPAAAVPAPLTTCHPAFGSAGSNITRYSAPLTGPGTEMFAPNVELKLTSTDDCAVR